MLACLSISEAGLASSVQSDEPDVQIRGCWYSGSAPTGCGLTGGARWFYAYPRGQADAPASRVIQVGRDLSVRVLPPTDPGIPEPVRKQLEVPWPRPSCEIGSGRTGRGCDFTIRTEDGEASDFRILPYGILQERAGRYRLFQPQLDDQRNLPATPEVTYGVPVGQEAEYVARSLQSDDHPPAELGLHVKVERRLYFGLLGGFSEGYGSIGGLVEFDLETATSKVHRPASLLEVHVTDMTYARKVIWMGTTHFAEHGEIGLSGMVAFDPETARFRSYTIANSPISSNSVWMVKQQLGPYDGRGPSVWIGTDRGLTVFHIDQDAWASWIWKQGPAGSPLLERVPAL